MKKILSLTIVFILLLVVAIPMVDAKTSNPNANSNGQVPEVSGDYPVLGRSDMRVRVFVMDHKDARGGNRKKPPKDPTPTPDPDPTPPPGPTCADPDSNSIIGATGWYLPAQNINYSINESSVVSGVSSSQFESITQNGFAQWNAAIQLSGSNSAKPNPNYIGSTGANRSRQDWNNIISFGRTQNTTLGVTYTWYYTATGEVAEVDTILNKRINWVVNTCSENSYDLNGIMVHEQGHWYGLNDHYTSAYENNTMYGTADRAETKKSTIEQGDIDGLNLIY